MTNYDQHVKVITVGNSGVGKTSISRALFRQFDPKGSATIGPDVSIKMMHIRNKKVKLTIWDTAGQEKYQSLNSAHYRRVHGVIVTYDITDRETLEPGVNMWLKETGTYCDLSSIVLCLVGNKTDLQARREVSRYEGADFAKENGMLFFETSAKRLEGVSNMFNDLTERILDLPRVNNAFSKPVQFWNEVSPRRRSCCSGAPILEEPLLQKSPLQIVSKVRCNTIPKSCRLVSGKSLDDEKSNLDNIYTLESQPMIEIKQEPVTAQDFQQIEEIAPKIKEETLKLYDEMSIKFSKYKVRSGWFISYKTSNGFDVLAERLYRDLDGDNWLDRYHSGVRTKEAMVKGILRRDKFIICVSPKYFLSDWCVIELTTALRAQKTIVPTFNQDNFTAGDMLKCIPACFVELKSNDFIGLYLDTIPNTPQIMKVRKAGLKRKGSLWDDSEAEEKSASLCPCCYQCY